MKEAFEIARIIQKSLKGRLSESEEKLLSDWRKVSDENEHAFQRMISEDFYTVGMEKLETYDYRVAYGRFLQKKYQQRRKRRFLINMARVAAVALPFVIALVLYVGLNREEEQTLRPSLASNILPGTSKAVLTLANGQMIPLGKETTDSTIITDGTQISASESGITYADGGESEAVVYNKLDIPRGGEFCLTLSDGTRVWLNSETSIQYPVVFGTKERRVFIQGEAYFEVAKDAKKPFTVQFMSSSVTVLGTSFNVMAYPDERHTEITLLKGAVVVEAAGRNQYIKPGQQVQVDNVSKEMNCREVNAGRYASWKDGLFDFEGMKLEDLAVELSRWYDVDFFFIHAASGQKKFTGAIKRNNSLQFMLDFIEKTSDVRFEVKENVVRVYNR